MRVCDNCGTSSSEAFCPSCGRPFPPPIPGEPHHDQVEFQPPAEPQRPVYLEPSPTQVSRYTYRQDRSQSYQYCHETYRYRGPTEVGVFTMPKNDASTAYGLGVLSVVFAFVFGVLGIVFGVMAIYLGRKAQREGLARADAAVRMGYIGIALSVLFTLLLIGMLTSLFSMR